MLQTTVPIACVSYLFHYNLFKTLSFLSIRFKYFIKRKIKGIRFRRIQYNSNKAGLGFPFIEPSVVEAAYFIRRIHHKHR